MIRSKPRLLKALKDLQILIEKCGGPGGTPGPCPGGGRRKPSSKPSRKKPPKEPQPKTKPSKPSSSKPQKTNPKNLPKITIQIKDQVSKLRQGKNYDLNTLSGTLGYFASAAVKTFDKALGRAEKAVSKLELRNREVRDKLTKKLDGIKNTKNSIVKGITERFSRTTKIFKRLKNLVKSTEKELGNQAADEVEGILSEGEKLQRLIRNIDKVVEEAEG